MSDFPPNIDPKISSIVATIIGYALIDDFTAVEQIAIGNWLIQIGQTMVTTAQFQRVIEERIAGNIININSRQFKCGGSPYIQSTYKPNFDNIKNSFENIFQAEQIQILKDAIEKINRELEKFNKDN